MASTPRNLVLRTRLARLYVLENQHDKAAPHVEAVLEAEPDNSTALELSLDLKRRQGSEAALVTVRLINTCDGLPTEAGSSGTNGTSLVIR